VSLTIWPFDLVSVLEGKDSQLYSQPTARSSGIVIQLILVSLELRRTLMPGNVMAGSSARLQEPATYAGVFPSRGPRDGLQFLSAATLLATGTTGAGGTLHRLESVPVRSGSEWEEISLAVHRLRTNCFQYRWVKRFVDVIIVCGLLPLLLPLLLIAAAIVRLSSPGPILYRQKRVGRFGREFSLWKFRSMYVNGDEILREHIKANPEAAREWAESRKLKWDPRITPLGRVLRRTSLDELPQFLNVLLGSMSLVGPRPIVAAEKAHYNEAYFFYASAKPGLSGLWQVSGRSDLSYHQRVALDEQYVRTWNIALDLEILCRTAAVVWGVKGAV
jgi:exopolysaccharide production protein ExoY